MLCKVADNKIISIMDCTRVHRFFEREYLYFFNQYLDSTYIKIAVCDSYLSTRQTV